MATEGGLSFLNGVCVAVDAIPGAYLVWGGSGSVSAAMAVQSRNNMRCRLGSSVGRASDVPPDADVVFCGRASGLRSDKLVCLIPPASRGGDWLDGYSRACEALARGLSLDKGRAGKDSVAVVGYLFDRDEPDHRGNLRELGRLLSGLGLKLSSVWLSGSGVGDLGKVEDASVILSLPYARRAARILGSRLSAKVVEVELPLGLTATESLVRTAARAMGRERLAEALLERELAAAVEDTRDHVSRVISGRTARLTLADPHLRRALEGLCSDMGLEVLAGRGGAKGPSIVFGARSRPEAERPGRHREWRWSAGARSKADIVVPLGYPNLEDHPVVERPFLGFSGFRSLVETSAERILAHEAGAGTWL
ncbi:MAG: hypothetical protein HZB91_12330 [Elusimicrobia bacterium]|nr:hypothetical protein [Elusimicrobiota bacterium]